MTFASQITIARILLVPVFAWLALCYGSSVASGTPNEFFRWAALTVFVVASASDGIDGWVARRFNQCSDFGAFIDPIADKSLLLVAVVVLWWADWGQNDWKLPGWYASLVIARDSVILIGVRLLMSYRRRIKIAPHLSGKVSTVLQMFALGWVMLGWVPFSPVWPCVISAIAILWSGQNYILQGWRILKETPTPTK